MANDNINITATLDTQQFDSSLKGMMQEMKALKAQLGNNILSPQEQQKVLVRMGELKKGIQGLKDQVAAVGSESAFVNLSKAITPLIGGLTAAAGALSLFGVENEKLNKIIQASQALTVGLMAINQIKELDDMKGAALAYAAAIKKFVLDKLMFKQTVAQTVADNAGAKAKGLQALWTGIVTKAQWAWNAAMSANPILLVVTAVAALVAGITLLVMWLNKSEKGLVQQKTRQFFLVV